MARLDVSERRAAGGASRRGKGVLYLGEGLVCLDVSERCVQAGQRLTWSLPVSVTVTVAAPAAGACEGVCVWCVREGCVVRVIRRVFYG